MYALDKEMGRVRTGRASANMLDVVKGDSYGTLTPLSQMASVSVPEPRLLVIQPWDATALKEIEKGILKLRERDRRRSQKLTAWLGKVEQRFAGRILPLDAAALHVWAQIAARAELAGQPLPVMDSLLMASAQCHGLTVVTRNIDDFKRCGARCFNPWDEA